MATSAFRRRSGCMGMLTATIFLHRMTKNMPWLSSSSHPLEVRWSDQLSAASLQVRYVRSCHDFWEHKLKTYGLSLVEYAALHWIFWTQLIFGCFVQVLHFFLVPETRSIIILDREAKKRRSKGEEVYGVNEANTDRLSIKDVLIIWGRPFHMLFTVGCFSSRVTIHL